MDRIRRLALLGVLLLSIASVPVRAATTPSLRIWTANDRGMADLMPGGRMIVVIALRSEEQHTAFAQHLAPDGLMLESATASSGTVVSDPFVSWTGVVSSTQMVNITLLYRVAPDAKAGDRVIKAQAQVHGELLKASTLIRVCCIPAPPAAQPAYRVYLAAAQR